MGQKEERKGREKRETGMGNEEPEKERERGGSGRSGSRTRVPGAGRSKDLPVCRCPPWVADRAVDSSMMPSWS